MMGDGPFPSPIQHAIVLFDGECAMCSRSVAWIVRRDPCARFRFAALRSAEGAAELERAQGGRGVPDSIVLIDSGRVLTRSDAVIGIARRLGFPWSVAIIAGVIPRPWRDGLYRWVARNRHSWFGKSAVCLVPTPELRSRMLGESGPTSPGS